MPSDLKLTNRNCANCAVQQLLDCAGRIIAAMDEKDGDPDLEPSLGYHRPYAPASMVDVEGVPETKKGPAAFESDRALILSAPPRRKGKCKADSDHDGKNQKTHVALRAEAKRRSSQIQVLRP